MNIIESMSRKVLARVISRLLKSAQTPGDRTITLNGIAYKEGDTVMLSGKPHLIMEIRQTSIGQKEAELWSNDGITTTMPGDSKSITVPIGKETVTFTEGKEGWNHLGTYKILSLNDQTKTMDVEFTNGTKKTFNIVTQAQILLNEASRNRQQMRVKQLNLTGPDEAFTLGYLASHGSIYVMIGPDHEAYFIKWYNRVTSDDFKSHLNRDAWIRKEEGGDYLRVTFPMPDVAAMNKMTLQEGEVVPLLYDKGNTAQFNSHNFVRNLFLLGFHIGKNNDSASIDRIRKKVVDNESFDKGLAYTPAPATIPSPAIAPIAPSAPATFSQPSANRKIRLTKQAWTQIGLKAGWLAS